MHISVCGIWFWTKCDKCEKDGKAYIKPYTLLCVAYDFGQSVRSVRRIAKHILKEFEKASEVLNTSPNAKILGLVISQDSHVLSMLC